MRGGGVVRTAWGGGVNIFLFGAERSTHLMYFGVSGLVARLQIHKTCCSFSSTCVKKRETARDKGIFERAMDNAPVKPRSETAPWA